MPVANVGTWGKRSQPGRLIPGGIYTEPTDVHVMIGRARQTAVMIGRTNPTHAMTGRTYTITAMVGKGR